MEPMWLQAQAVPTAELVPCVAVAAAWGGRSGLLTVNNGRSTITLDHDRAGVRGGPVALRRGVRRRGRRRGPRPTFPAPVGSPGRAQAGTNVVLTRYEVFPGGSAMVTVSSRTASPAVVDAVTAQVDRLLDYVTRPRQARALDRRSDGRLHLDPPG